jgi:hypothetical protein
MSITNTPKPGAGTQTNINRAVDYETWDSWDVAWQSETRTWDELRTLMSNTSKPSSSGITNTPKPI